MPRFNIHYDDRPEVAKTVDAVTAFDAARVVFNTLGYGSTCRVGPVVGFAQKWAIVSRTTGVVRFYFDIREAK